MAIPVAFVTATGAFISFAADYVLKPGEQRENFADFPVNFSMQTHHVENNAGVYSIVAGAPFQETRIQQCVKIGIAHDASIRAHWREDNPTWYDTTKDWAKVMGAGTKKIIQAAANTDAVKDVAVKIWQTLDNSEDVRVLVGDVAPYPTWYTYALTLATEAQWRGWLDANWMMILKTEYQAVLNGALPGYVQIQHTLPKANPTDPDVNITVGYYTVPRAEWENFSIRQYA